MKKTLMESYLSLVWWHLDPSYIIKVNQWWYISIEVLHKMWDAYISASVIQEVIVLLKQEGMGVFIQKTKLSAL